MSFIIVIDDSDNLSDPVQECVDSSGLEVVLFEDVGEAKKSLMEDIPRLILCKSQIADDERAGLKLCSDLRDHDNFASIPVLLFVEEVKEDIIKGAQHFGARGVFSIPVIVAELSSVLAQLLPGVVKPLDGEATSPVEEEEEDEEEWDDEEEEDGLEFGDSEDMSDNLTYAQHILSTVLNNLKTSDLIHIVEPEDVPRIVFEMARTVCDIKEEKPDSLDEEDDIDMDLDAAFGFNKKGK